MLTNKEISKKICDHLTAQKAQSLRDAFHEGECAYRGEGGKMCAVGVLLADEDYSPDMEGCGIGMCQSDPRWVRLHRALTARYGSHIDFGMLAEWQRYHDGKAYEDWCYSNDGVSPFEFHKHLEARGAF